MEMMPPDVFAITVSKCLSLRDVVTTIALDLAWLYAKRRHHPGSVRPRTHDVTSKVVWGIFFCS
jgi:hypothetical protein